MNPQTLKTGTGIAISVSVKGEKEIQDRLHKTIKKLPEDATVGCLRAGMVFESRAKWYASGNAGGPNVDTGFLRNSITTTEEPDGASVAPHADYAAFVEFGVGLKPNPRPFMRPAYEDEYDNAMKVLEDYVGRRVSINFGQGNAI